MLVYNNKIREKNVIPIKKKYVCIIFISGSNSMKSLRDTRCFWSERCDYQLIKELFPAEWFPIIITIIFFRGGNSLTPKLSAIFTNPVKNIQTKGALLSLHDVLLLSSNNSKRIILWYFDGTVLYSKCAYKHAICTWIYCNCMLLPCKGHFSLDELEDIV